MSDNEQVIKQIGELERKISDGESLLRRTVEASTIGWVFMAVGVILVFMLWGGFWSVIGALFVLASVWRLYTAAKYQKEIEEGLREYRGQRAELQASLISKD
jgi:type III secretory pathway component EscT